jgi:predicted DNA-binding protein
MTTKVPKPTRRIGRPPAGASAGEKVKDYPQLSIRVPVEIKAKLVALSVVTNRPQWRIITDAIECHYREQPDSDRRMVEDLMGRARRAGSQRPRR